MWYCSSESVHEAWSSWWQFCMADQLVFSVGGFLSVYSQAELLILVYLEQHDREKGRGSKRGVKKVNIKPTSPQIAPLCMLV